MPKEITAAQRASVAKYESRVYDKILLRIPKGERERIRAAADAAGESLNGYIVQAVQARMQTGK